MFAVELHDTTEQLTEKVEDEENHAVIVEKVAEGAYSTSAPVLRSPPPPAPPPPASSAVSRLDLGLPPHPLCSAARTGDELSAQAVRRARS